MLAVVTVAVVTIVFILAIVVAILLLFLRYSVGILTAPAAVTSAPFLLCVMLLIGGDASARVRPIAEASTPVHRRAYGAGWGCSAHREYASPSILTIPLYR